MSGTLEERVAILEKKVAEYEGSREFLSDQIRGVHRRLIHFEKEVKGRFDVVDERFSSLESRMDSLEKKVDAIVPAVAQVIQQELIKLKTNS